MGGRRCVAGARGRVLGSSQGEQRGQSNKSELHFDKSETTDVVVLMKRFVKGKKLAERSNERRWREKKKRKRRRRNNKRGRKQPGAKKQKNKAQATAALAAGATRDRLRQFERESHSFRDFFWCYD